MSDSAPFDPAAVGAKSTPKRVSWNARDCMLYALGVGAGTEDLEFTTNNTRGVNQVMVPTMPVTLGVDFSVLKQAGRFDWAKLLHAEQRVEVLGDIPVDGEADVVTEIVEMWDKEKAALVVAQTTGTSVDGDVLWRSSAGLFVRGAGGWGGSRGPASEPASFGGAPSTTKTVTYVTRADQALIYRLSGDHNPLHSDPAFAARAGMDRPILHGLCTFGFAGRAVREVAGSNRKLATMNARFAGPVWPGDSLAIDVESIDDGSVRFSVRGRDDKEVLNGGTATFAPA